MTLVVGGPDSGKTYYLLPIIEKLGQKKPVVIYDSSGGEEKIQKFPVLKASEIQRNGSKLPPGVYRFCTTNEVEAFQLFRDYLRMACIVFDDASDYVDSNIPMPLKSIISVRRQLRLDLFFVFHNFKGVPPRIAGIVDYVVIKKTGDNLIDLKSLNKLPAPAKVINAWQKVMASSDPYAMATIKTR
jgi:hypothetical protein